MLEMENDIKKRVLAEGFSNVEVETVLTPTWTTDWILKREGRRFRNMELRHPSRLLQTSLL